MNRILRPTEIEKKGLLVETLANTLWTAGENKYACVALNRQVTCFSWDKNNKSKESYYVPDGLTEKVSQMTLPVFCDQYFLNYILLKNS